MFCLHWKGVFMCKEIRGNQKHMSLEDRNYIEQALGKGMTFNEIAKFLRKNPTTISKEVKKHRVCKPRNSYGSGNDCISKQHCTIKHSCGNVRCYKRCASCSLCRDHCMIYIREGCKDINKAPFVCNGCETKKACRYEKYYYQSLSAHNRYRHDLSVTREGINLTPEQLSELDKLVTPFILKGQPIAHIFANNANAIPCSSRTIYNYIDNNIITAKNIDLPRKVTYKPRKSKKKKEVNHTWKEGRKYSDFVAFIESYPEVSIVEMDTVEGLKGGKVLLTMLFRNSNCMLAFLLPDKTQASIVSVFNSLEEKLGSILFHKTFPVILTDNGSEFNNPLLLEIGKEDFLRTSIYYCDPYASYQKGRLEKNHEFIRYVVPKGKSFDGYIQEDITLMINHINSTARDGLNGRTPFELASLLLDKTVIETMALTEIKHNMVHLKPKLLKK